MRINDLNINLRLLLFMIYNNIIYIVPYFHYNSINQNKKNNYILTIICSHYKNINIQQLKCIYLPFIIVNAFIFEYEDISGS